jgi:N-acetylneuraminic acid mutarotase
VSVQARRLPLAVSRAVAVPRGSDVTLAGGLNSAGTSTDAVYRLDPMTDRLTRTGQLAEPTHDAAGALLRGRLYVFGGGTTSSVATIQRVVPQGRADVVGHLPTTRSDLAAVTVGGAAYVLGGYTGTKPAAQVLRTRDGRRLHAVSRLPVPVRYGAVVAVGHDVWVYGGEYEGHPVDAIQRVDLDSGSARVVGHLGHALSDAAAWLLADHVVLAGGRLASGHVTGRILVFGAGGTHPVAERRLARPIADGAPVTVDGVGYLVGGEVTRPRAVIQRIELS